MFIPFAIIFLGFGTASYLWGFWYRRSPHPEPLSSFWIVAAEVIGSLLILLALYEAALVYTFTGVRVAEVTSGTVLVPLTLGVTLWGSAIVSDWALARGRREGVWPVPKPLGRQVVPSGEGGTVTPVTEDDERVRGLYHEIAQAVQSLSDVARPLVRQAIFLTTGLLALVGLFLLVSAVHGEAPNGWATLVIFSASVAGILYVFAWTWLGWLAQVRRDLRGEQVPVDPFPRWTPLLQNANQVEPSPEEVTGTPSTGEGSSTLERSLSLLRLGHRLEKLSRQSLTGIFLGVLLAGSLLTYLVVASILDHFVCGPTLSCFSNVAEVAWLAPGFVVILSFFLLHRKYRPVARVDRMLTSLEAEEIELERAFWSRF